MLKGRGCMISLEKNVFVLQGKLECVHKRRREFYIISSEILDFTKAFDYT